MRLASLALLILALAVAVLRPFAGQSAQQVHAVGRAGSGIPVRVVNQHGEPMQGVQVQLAMRLVPTAAEIRSGLVSDFFPPIGEESVTDADGNAWLSTDFDRATLARLKMDTRPYELRVRAILACNVQQEAEASSLRNQPLLIRFDQTAQARIRLENYPDDSVPVLRGLGAGPGEPSAFPRQQPDAKGYWIFDNVPLVPHFQVAIYHSHDRPGEERWLPTDLASQRIEGPGHVDEVITEALRREAGSVLRCRVLRADGRDFDPHDSERFLFQAFARASDPGVADPSVVLEDLGEGHYELTLSSGSSVQDWNEVEELFLLVTRVHSLVHGTGVEAFSWLRTKLDVRRGFDLGELQLGQQDPLLELHAVDRAGNPVAYALVKLFAEVERRGEVRWARATTFLGASMTDEKGVLRIVGFDLAHAAQVSPIFGEVTGSYQARLEHRDYQPAAVEVTAATARTEIVLDRAQ